jgi:hypothetical protein
MIRLSTPVLHSSAITLKIARDLSSEIADSMSCIVEIVSTASDTISADECISILLGRNREI